VTTPDAARRFFDAIAGRYDRVYAPPSSESRARMSRVLAALSPRSRVLDLGVGTGRELPALLDAGHTVVGLDVSPEMLERCARRARPVRLVLGDLWAPLPFEAGAFDAVIALHGTLAHPPGEGALGPLALEIARVLSPAGAFVMEAPLPSWTAGTGEDLVRADQGRAIFTDRATGEAIEARFFEERAWRASLAPHLAVTTALDTGGELFLAATKV
jgi:SAM-dependent methyltransferase